MPNLHTLLLIAAVGVATSACTPGQKPTDQPPEPTAVATASQLSDAIQQPLDKARSVEGTVNENAERQKAAIDAAAH
jgi:hypothetical protein